MIYLTNWWDFMKRTTKLPRGIKWTDFITWDTNKLVLIDNVNLPNQRPICHFTRTVLFAPVCATQYGDVSSKKRHLVMDTLILFENDENHFVRAIDHYLPMPRGVSAHDVVKTLAIGKLFCDVRFNILFRRCWHE